MRETPRVEAHAQLTRSNSWQLVASLKALRVTRRAMRAATRRRRQQHEGDELHRYRPTQCFITRLTCGGFASKDS